MLKKSLCWDGFTLYERQCLLVRKDVSWRMSHFGLIGNRNDPIKRQANEFIKNIYSKRVSKGYILHSKG